MEGYALWGMLGSWIPKLLTRKAKAALVKAGFAGVAFCVFIGARQADAIPPQRVIISEIAWAGTAASANDEWIELYNPGDSPVDLTGWRLVAADGKPAIDLQGTIPPHGFFLLERTDDSTVSDIPADQIYTGALSNTGEALTLFGPNGEVVDTANRDGGPWPAGDAATRASMERIGLATDGDTAWGTHEGPGCGHDASGAPLHGSPKCANSVNQPVPTLPPTASSAPTSPSPTLTVSPTPSLTATPYSTASPTVTPTVTSSLTLTPSAIPPSPTPTVSPSLTATPAPMPGPTFTLTPTPSPTLPPTLTSTPSPTATFTPSLTSTATSAPTPTFTPTPVPPRRIIISEIAWAGTTASANDEWIELYNPGDAPVDLTGWRLVAADGKPAIDLQGTIPPHGFFLLERTDDSTVSDIPADQIYTGALSNTGEALTLFGPNGEVVDTANRDSGPWPAGDAATRASMERRDLAPDGPGAWGTHAAHHACGHDATGNPLHASAKCPNSVNFAPPTATPTPSLPPTATPTPTAIQTLTPSPTVTPTLPPSPTPTVTPNPTPAPYRSVIINEVAWAGTAASANDEWIELYNPGNHPIDLTGWRLIAADGKPNIALQGTIPPRGFFLLERTDDSTVSDIPADQIYTGGLSNAGETLLLLDPTGQIIDRVNGGTRWPAGGTSPRASMERLGLGDRWQTFPGYGGCGHDAQGHPISGTPHCPNASLRPTPTPPPGVAWVRINEFLPHPRYDWNGDGQANNGDEFIELINLGPQPVSLTGWKLDDGPQGSPPYILPETVLPPGKRLVLFATQTGISLSDQGDMVRLFTPFGFLVDQRVYLNASEWNLSWCRLNGGPIVYACWPTPGGRNAAYRIVTPSQGLGVRGTQPAPQGGSHLLGSGQSPRSSPGPPRSSGILWWLPRPRIWIQ